MTQIMARTTSLLPAVNENKVSIEMLFYKISPVATCFAISLVLGNLAYIYLSVSYIQMLKASTPVAVLLLSFLCGIEKPMHTELGIIVIIACGVAVTSAGERRFSWIGFVCQVIQKVSQFNPKCTRKKGKRKRFKPEIVTRPVTT